MQKVCECKTVYAADAPACPHCGSTEAVDDHEFVGEAGPEVVDLPAGGNVKPKK